MGGLVGFAAVGDDFAGGAAAEVVLGVADWTASLESLRGCHGL